MRYAEVIIDINSSNVDKIYDYAVPDDIDVKPGIRVVVDFNKRLVEGFIVGVKEKSDVDSSRIKSIMRIIDSKPVLTEKQLVLAYWMKERYLCHLVEALRCIMPVDVKKSMEMAHMVVELKVSIAEIEQFIFSNKKNTRQIAVLKELLNRGDNPVKASELIKATGSDYGVLKRLKEKGLIDVYYIDTEKNPYSSCNYGRTERLELTAEQRKALDEIKKGMDASKGKYLIHGVTGSGKTEIFLQAIEYNIKKGKDAIVLVPEISLTPQTIERFKGRFGDNVAVLHSRLSDGERIDQWKRIMDGKVKVVVGVRSAVFAPFKNLGLVIVDEEHESTYKQSDMRPKYDAREVAERRCELEGAVLVLASATPSILNYYRAVEGHLNLLRLKKRVNNKKLPYVHIVDMRQELMSGNRSIFSKELYDEMKNTLARKEQLILFLNRRGFYTFVSCRLCGYVMKCPHCNISLTFHADGTLQCHYCGYSIYMPKSCPACGQNSIRYFGMGTERVEKEVKALFPDARILRMDVDTTRKKGSFEKIYTAFKNREADILIGTQMISKGLDFPGVSLVGIITADTALNFPEYNASERTFQLITQVAGRAGRGNRQGKVIIQTYYPDHYAILCAKNHDYEGFYRREITFREKSDYPPFSELAVFTLSGFDDKIVKEKSMLLYDIIETYNEPDIQVFKPMPAMLHKLRDKYRWNIVLKSKNGDILRYTINRSYDKIKSMLDKDVLISYDINYITLI
ncbi:replication restart DNA helicase PriA [Caldanaerobius fijiensis DSM 17918]|uniref:Replication restart protein PriA n=1 Tax=Caldanaerobius fijiensis DSM 17918 TaxID=1121256 RepID=A0A1M4ZPX7_9THEO|nr:primosomal protein N' [Caldanaerobius fijiensis]SHF20160.1 replication restart DNA helicase PriA [Caldanaerobius fijiensis DSM 17918]